MTHFKKKSLLKKTLVNFLASPLVLVSLVLTVIFMLTDKAWRNAKKANLWIEAHQKGYVSRKSRR